MSILSSVLAAGATVATGGAASGAAAAGSLIPGIHIDFRAPSDARARAVIGQVISSAEGGNLTAAAVLDQRRFFGIVAERAVWASGWNTFVQAAPAVAASYAQHKAEIPAIDNSTPETAAQSALSRAYYVGAGAPAQSGVPTGVTVQGSGVAGFFDALLNAIGLGPARQNELAAQAGAAAGQQAAGTLSRTVIVVALILVAGVLFYRFGAKYR